MNRATHKGILIGKGGSSLKVVGTMAREKLEAVSFVYLSCSVYVYIDDIVIMYPVYSNRIVE